MFDYLLECRAAAHQHPDVGVTVTYCCTYVGRLAGHVASVFFRYMYLINCSDGAEVDANDESTGDSDGSERADSRAELIAIVDHEHTTTET